MNMKKLEIINKVKVLDIYIKKHKMKNFNQTYIDSLINKVITETLEEKADKLVSKIKSKIPSDEEVDDMMSSYVEEGETCEQCGSGIREGEQCEQCSKSMYEGESVGKLKNAPTSFDYVQEEDEYETSTEDELEIMSADDDGDPLDRVNRFCNRKSEEYNEDSCKYHKKLEMEMKEELHGKQHKLDVAEPKGKLTKADFLKLGKMKGKKKETDEQWQMVVEPAVAAATTWALDKAFNESDEVYEDYDMDIDNDMGGGYYKRYDIDPEEDAAYHKFVSLFPGVAPDSDDLRKMNSREGMAQLKREYNKIMRRNELDIDDPDFRTQGGFMAGEMVSEDGETEEGNAFTAKLKQTPKGGTFELDGKKYKDTSNLGEGKKFIQKATEKMDKKGTEGKFGAWCKRNGLASDEGEVTKKCIDKAMKSDNSSVVKMANFAKNIKGYSGSEHKKKSVKLKESEMIDLIERIIMEEKESNIKVGTAKGLEKYKQVHAKDGKENNEALKATAKKMKEYLKDGSKGDYEPNPKHFPKGNGELAKMSKKAYVMSDAGKEFIDDYMSPGMEDLVPDQIQYDENWVEDNIKGSSRTGNNPEWANAEETELGDRLSKKQKAKKFHKAKEQAYRKSKQPVTDGTGENSGEGINIKVESLEPKKAKLINEEFERMKSLISYNQKTQ